MDNKAAELQSLVDELIVKAANNQLFATEENVQQALYFLLRSYHASLCKDPNWDYVQMKFHAAFNLLTGQTVFPF